jgi:hypothetical protein
MSDDLVVMLMRLATYVEILRKQGVLDGVERHHLANVDKYLAEIDRLWPKGSER